MKKLISLVIAISLTVAAGGNLFAQKKHSRVKREPIKMGAVMNGRDSSGKGVERLLEQHLFIPKGAKGAGIQFSYFDLNSSDSELLLLIQNLNGFGSYFSVAPYATYCIKDNRVLGVKLKYSNAETGISSADLRLLCDGLSLEIQDVKGILNSISGEFFYRSYLGLDNHGRFGLFIDEYVTVSHSTTFFSYDEAGIGARTVANNVKIGALPGLEVFMMNNISSYVAIGIGGVSYTNTKCYKDNELVGTRNVSKARFMVDVANISMGLTIHF